MALPLFLYTVRRKKHTTPEQIVSAVEACEIEEMFPTTTIKDKISWSLLEIRITGVANCIKHVSLALSD